MITGKASQGFHTRDTHTSDFWEQGTIKSLPPPYSHVWTSENTGITLQQYLFL